MSNKHCDLGNCEVVVVGAGVAGLSAALTLGRCARRVFLFDGGTPRNGPADSSHGYLSRDGIESPEFRATCIEQLRPYTVTLVNEAVRTLSHSLEGFIVKGKNSVVHCRRILLATGAKDDLELLPGLKDAWGKTAFSCPYCHAFEVRGGSLAVIGADDTAADLCILLSCWTATILCFASQPQFDSVHMERFKLLNIQLVSDPVQQLSTSGKSCTIMTQSGRSYRCDRVFLNPRTRFSTALATSIGCTLTENGGIKTDCFGATNIAGVYAAGEVCGTSGQMISIAAEALRVARSINTSLLVDWLNAATAR